MSTAKVARGLLGVVFDLAEQGLAPVEVCPLAPAVRGQVGHWGVCAAQWFFRDWISEWQPADNVLLHARTIAVVGCRPIFGTRDPLPGTSGPICEFYFTITHAVAGESERTIYVHPSADGTMKQVITSSGAERTARQRTREHLQALYPKLPPQFHHG